MRTATHTVSGRSEKKAPPSIEHLRPRNLHSHQSEQLDACGARHLLSQDLHANQSDRPRPIAVMVSLGHLIQVECVLRHL